MGNETEDYIYDFYGPSSRWFAVTISTISSFIVLSNLFFILITMTDKYLRSKSSVWFLVGFAISDFLHGSAHCFDGFAIWTGSVKNRHLCSLAGTFVVFTAVSSFGFPFLIAADRYYKITIPDIGKFSLGTTLFSDRYIIPLIIFWFLFTALGSTLPLLLSNAFGEDPGGFCGAKKFRDLYLYVLYELTGTSVFFVSLLLSALYYMRLAKWLKENQFSANNVEGRRYTQEIMKVMMIITIMPVLLAMPGVGLTAGQMILPEMAMWLKRAITVPYFLSSVANPWLTICLVRPFRRRVLHLLLKQNTVTAVTAVTSEREINLNSTRPTRMTLHPISSSSNV